MRSCFEPKPDQLTDAQTYDICIAESSWGCFFQSEILMLMLMQVCILNSFHAVHLISPSPCHEQLIPTDTTAPVPCTTSLPPSPLSSLWGVFQVGKTHCLPRSIVVSAKTYPTTHPKPSPKPNFSSLPLIVSAGFMIYSLLLIYASWLATKRPGACLHSLGVMLQINKDATMLYRCAP